MFAEACSRVSDFTKPLVISTRHQDGSVSSEVGTFIVLNREGWVMTAGHMYNSFSKFQSDVNKAKEIEEINNGRMARPGSPSSMVKLDPKLITNHSFWWGWDGVQVKTTYVNNQIDIAFGKLEPFNPDWVRSYPILRDPATLRPGTSVCRSGYSFMDIKSTWNDEKKSFQIPRIPERDVIFFNEGMHTRTVSKGPSKDGGFAIRYVETSTPGLRGQSGGPIFDTEGRVYAMQVKTAHLPLGFQPTVEYEGRTVVENQFLNVGLGVHVGTIRDILDKHGVRYTAEGDDTGYRIVG